VEIAGAGRHPKARGSSPRVSGYACERAWESLICITRGGGRWKLPGREDIPKPGVPVPGFRDMRVSGRGKV